MSANDICFLTIEQFGLRLRNGEISSVELVDAFIDRYRRIGHVTNCYIEFVDDRARLQASALDSLLNLGIDLGPLHGVPIAIKDNIDTSGIPTTSGSPIDKDRVPSQDSTVVRRLHAAGAVVLGKANMYEWAFGSPSSLFGDVANPWDLTRTAGASSSGSAAAVAAGLATAAIGTDLGGSIRIPASMCGVFGLKPTYGLVSRFGVRPLGQTLDHVGPITRTAKDAQIVLDAIRGPDPLDAVSQNHPAILGSAAGKDLRGVVVGVAVPQLGHEVSADVALILEQVVEVFEQLGCPIVEVHLPSLDDARSAMWTISAVEGAEFHLPMMRETLDQYPDKTRRLLLGGALTSGLQYVRAQRVRQKMCMDLDDLFERVSIILTPVLRSAAWKAASSTSHEEDDSMTEMTHFTPLFNLTGHPAASFVGGFTDAGLPVGVQIASALYGEATLIALAAEYENVTGHAGRRPEVNTDQYPGSTADHGA